MKLTKRIMACVLAVAVMLTSALTVMAAGSISRDGGETVTEKSAVYETVKTTMPNIADAIVKVNTGKMTMEQFIAAIEKDAATLTGEAKDKLIAIADKLKDKELVSAFYTLKENDTKAKVEKTEDGKYKVTLNVQNLTKSLTGLKVLYFNTEKGEWEILEIPADAVDYTNHTVTFTVEDISLLAVISDATPAK